MIENPWFCNDCNEFKEAYKKMEIYLAPIYLVINLKRYKSGNTIYKERLNTLVTFPLEGFDLS